MIQDYSGYFQKYFQYFFFQELQIFQIFRPFFRLISCALSPNWESMIKSRKVIIENTVKKIFGDGIILNFSTKQLNKSNPTNTPEITQNEVNNFRPIKKIEPKTNSSTKISNEETYDDSSKNLANFFNGEIIDLDE